MRRRLGLGLGLVFLATASAWRETYLKAMEEYFDGPALECIRRQQFDHWGALNLFETIGLEGVGHHVVESLPKDIAGTRKGKKPGGQDSFPYKRAWAKIQVNGDGEPLQKILNANFAKFLILVRDPVDSWSSALRRYWHLEKWPLDVELNQLNQSIFDVHDVVSKIPCHQKFYIPFEYLVREPASLNAVAAFLGVDPYKHSYELEKLHVWYQETFHQKPGFERKGVVVPHASQISEDSLPWPEPLPRDCHSSDSALTEKLIIAGTKGNWTADFVLPDCVNDLTRVNVTYGRYRIAPDCAADIIGDFRRYVHNFVHNVVPPTIGSWPTSVPRRPMTLCKSRLP